MSDSFTAGGVDLLHGTDARLEHGDVIVPAEPGSHGGYRSWAYATPDPQAARYFGTFVYQVVPLEPADPPCWMPQYDNEPHMLEVTSTAGFVVTALVWADPAACTPG